MREIARPLSLKNVPIEYRRKLRKRGHIIIEFECLGEMPHLLQTEKDRKKY